MRHLDVPDALHNAAGPENHLVAIAEDMFIAEGTVKAHIQHIYAKLGIHSRKELFSLFEGQE